MANPSPRRAAWCAALLAGCMAGAAVAAVYTVDTTADGVVVDALTTLREAVRAANTNPGPDQIVLPAGRYYLTSVGAGEDAALTGDLDLLDDVTLTGAGGSDTLVDGNGLDRVFFINTGVAVALEDLAVIGGVASLGAGIYNQGTLRMTRCNLALNHATVYGGGLHNFSGEAYLADSSIFDNVAEAQGGGGIDVHNGSVTLTNCTVAGNYSLGGAGIYREGGTAGIADCTITSNRAQIGAGGVFSLSSARSSILAGNQAPLYPDVAVGVGSEGYNVFGPGNTISLLATDLVVADARLAVLDVSYACPVIPLQADSPALNAGDPAATTNTLANDQRGPGFPRVRGLRVDIGAFEHQQPDDDLDGMPDEWEVAFALNPTNAADGLLDPDLDSFVNADEFVADTVPTNGASFPRITGLAGAGDGSAWLLTVPSSTACLYRVETAAELGGTWSTGVVATAGLSGFTDLVITSAAPSHFRVQVARPAAP
jgi:hypothetical protein